MRAILTFHSVDESGSHLSYPPKTFNELLYRLEQRLELWIGLFAVVEQRLDVFDFTQFLTLCRAENPAEARYLSAPLQGSSPAKTRTSSRPSRAHGHHLRPSPNCEKLSGPLYPRGLIARGYLDNVLATLEHHGGLSPYP